MLLVSPSRSLERTAPTTTALIAMYPHQVILPLLVLLSNATFVVDGDIVPNSVQPDSVVCAIQEDTLLTIVHSHTFPLNRPLISTGLLPTRDRISPRGVLIELGV
jgi:hypothetical protein